MTVRQGGLCGQQPRCGGFEEKLKFISILLYRCSNCPEMGRLAANSAKALERL
jgi:hypothetical protein